MQMKVPWRKWILRIGMKWRNLKIVTGMVTKTITMIMIQIMIGMSETTRVILVTTVEIVEKYRAMY